MGAFLGKSPTNLLSENSLLLIVGVSMDCGKLIVCAPTIQGNTVFLFMKIGLNAGQHDLNKNVSFFVTSVACHHALYLSKRHLNFIWGQQTQKE